MTEKPRSKDPELNQYESDEDYEPQRQDAEGEIADVDANYDGNEIADERVRIEQPSGEEAPRA
ncbi:MAG: hypothetical protein ACRDK3_07380 [Actinomycetota bacterium]